MNAQDAWKISKITYQEVVFNAMLQANKYGLNFGRYKSADSFMRRIRRNAAMNKIIISIFLFIGSLSPYLSVLFSGNSIMTTMIISATSVSLLVSFAFVLFYEMQLLPYLINTPGIQALQLFPLSNKDISLVSLFTLLRTVDYPILAIIIGQIASELIIRSSIIFMILNFFISLFNIGFAISVALFLSKSFYKFVFSGSGGFIRFIYTLTWGLGVSVMYFLPSILQNFIPYIESIILTFHDKFSPILLLYPFPLVLMIINPTSISLPIFLTGIIYFLIIIWSIKRSVSFIQSIVFGYQARIRRFKSSLNIKIRSIIPAIIIKDIRLASRTPNLAFTLVLPIFEVILIIIGPSFRLTNFTTIAITSGTLIGGLLSILVSILFLSVDFSSITFVSTLPLKTRTIIIAKSFISLITYFPVFVVFLIFSKSFITFLFAFISVIPVMAGSILSPTIYLLIVNKGRLAAPSILSSPLHALIPLAIGMTIIALPTSVYVFFSYINPLYAIIGMSIISIIEIIASIMSLSSLKDT